MKIKIFTGIQGNVLEERVNEFIKDKRVIDIKYQSCFNERFVYGSVLVIYEEMAECEECKI